MLSKEKSLYQVKLILDYLPKEEYALIPDDLIRYVEDNAEYDEKIKINPNIPLEKQKLDAKTYDFLEKMLKEIDKNKSMKKSKRTEIAPNSSDDLKFEISKLREMIDQKNKELEKLPQAKELIEDYRKLLMEKDATIAKLTTDNENLVKSINHLPAFIRKIFMKDIHLMLNEKK